MIEYTKNFERDALIATSNKPLISNTIFPESFWESSKEMCEGNYEKAGWLICKKSFIKDYLIYIVEYPFTTDEGDMGSVYPSKRLNLPDDYSGVEFHIHPEGLGEYWFDKFSSGDYTTFSNRMRDNINYKHVLFTPTNILTFGKETPEFRVGKVSEEAFGELGNRYEYWHQIVNK